MDRPIGLSAIYIAPRQVGGVKKILITFFAFLAIVPFSSPAAELTILTKNLPNLNYLENGKLVRYSVDIIKEIQKRVGSTDEIKVFPWARAFKTALKEIRAANCGDFKCFLSKNAKNLTPKFDIYCQAKISFKW